MTIDVTTNRRHTSTYKLDLRCLPQLLPKQSTGVAFKDRARFMTARPFLYRQTESLLRTAHVMKSHMLSYRELDEGCGLGH